MTERLRNAEQAWGLPTELERRLKEEDDPELEPLLSQFDRQARPLPEADLIRGYIEAAAGSARVGRASRARR
jgi:hypothetical protein